MGKGAEVAMPAASVSPADRLRQRGASRREAIADGVTEKSEQLVYYPPHYIQSQHPLALYYACRM
jgi:hypothetical protein